MEAVTAYHSRSAMPPGLDGIFIDLRSNVGGYRGLRNFTYNTVSLVQYLRLSKYNDYSPLALFARTEI